MFFSFIYYYSEFSLGFKIKYYITNFYIENNKNRDLNKQFKIYQ